jgi:hypothetical protein
MTMDIDTNDNLMYLHNKIFGEDDSYDYLYCYHGKTLNIESSLSLSELGIKDRSIIYCIQQE